MKRQLNIRMVLSLISALAVFLFMCWADGHLDAYISRLLHLWAIWLIFGLAFNMIYGLAGQFSLAGAGLAAIGGYIVLLLTLSPREKEVMYVLEPPIWPISVIQWPFLPSLIAAGLVAAIFGLLIGGPALRLHGSYLAMATWGFSEIVRISANALPNVTNGALGIKGFERVTNLKWVWGIALLAIFVTKRLKDSSYGRALRAIREDEIAAEAMGVNLFPHKLLAYLFSAFFSGIAGALLVELLTALGPALFAPAINAQVITIVVLGGIGSITGNILGAGVFTLLFELFRVIDSPMHLGVITIPGRPGMRMLTLSFVLLGLMLFYRKGLMGRREFNWNAAFSRLQTLLAKARGQEIES